MIDLIIVNHNSNEFLHDCLASIKCSCDGLEPNVVVFDNDSKEPVEYLNKTYPDVQVVPSRENIGYSRAINKVLAETGSKYIVLLNPDTIVISDRFFESIAEYMDTNPDVGVLGTCVTDPDGCIQGSARSFPKLHSFLFGRNSLLTRIFPNCRLASANILTKNATREQPFDVDWVSGACMVIRREAITQTGELDERFFLYWEDVDMCKRMWGRGWRVTYWPGVKIMHHVGGSSESKVLRSVFEFHRSAMLYFHKHIRRYRLFLLPPIYAAISLRFIGILFIQVLRRSILNFRKKPQHEEADEAAQAWLYRSCVEHLFTKDLAN